MKPPGIIYVADYTSSFVKLDISLLSEIGTVRSFFLKPTDKRMLPLRLLFQFFFLMTHIFRSKLIVAQFAGYGSVLPALFGKMLKRPVIIVVGGTDASNFPDIGYGNYSKPMLARATKWSLQMASLVITPHPALIETEYRYCAEGGLKQGILAHFPEFATPWTAIPNVIDADFWTPGNEISVRSGIISVAVGIEKERSRRLKGMDLLIDLARKFPDVPVTLVGYRAVPDIPDLPPNVRLLPFQHRETLRELYRTHQFYAQLSISEGWGIALCEAMACGCIPIVSDVGAMPELAGGNGFILETRDAGALAKLYQVANMLPLEGRERQISDEIRGKYPIEVRRNALHEAVYGLIT